MLLAIPTWNAHEKMQSTIDNRVAIANELEVLSTREAALQEEIDRLSTDRGIEEEIRSKYQVGHEGEQMIVIVQEQEEVEDDGLIPLPEEKGLFSKLRSWL